LHDPVVRQTLLGDVDRRPELVPRLPGRGAPILAAKRVPAHVPARLALLLAGTVALHDGDGRTRLALRREESRHRERLEGHASNGAERRRRDAGVRRDHELRTGEHVIGEHSGTRQNDREARTQHATTASGESGSRAMSSWHGGRPYLCLIDAEEDPHLRAVLVGILREAKRA
jgi:hypothetical protein